MISRWLDIAADPVMFSTLENGKIVRGLAGIPSEGPVLYVGYHMLMGLDLPLLISSFLLKRNIFLRGIAHPVLFQKELERHLPDPSFFDVFKIFLFQKETSTNFLLQNLMFYYTQEVPVRDFIGRFIAD